MERLYTVREVAEILNMHEATVRRYIATGLISASRARRNTRIAPQAVQDYLDRNIVQPVVEEVAG